MTVVGRLERFLKDNPAIEPDPLAAAALALAAEIDGGESVAQSASAFQKVMVELRRMVPDDESEVSKVDELRERRKQKMGAAGA